MPKQEERLRCVVPCRTSTTGWTRFEQIATRRALCCITSSEKETAERRDHSHRPTPITPTQAQDHVDTTLFPSPATQYCKLTQNAFLYPNLAYGCQGNQEATEVLAAEFGQFCCCSSPVPPLAWASGDGRDTACPLLRQVLAP